MRLSTFYLLGGSALSVTPVLAQTAATTDYVHLAAAEEVALARSAAPEAVSAEATVWVLQDGRFVVAEKGSNGNHCFVMRSMPQSLEPICYDAEGASTAMRWEFRYLDLRLAGKSRQEIDRALTEAVASGDLPVPSRPAMGYMQSSGQHLFNPETGHDAGNWKPHLMLYIPNLTLRDVGLAKPTPNMFVFQEGTPRAHLIMVTPEFVDPKAP